MALDARDHLGLSDSSFNPSEYYSTFLLAIPNTTPNHTSYQRHQTLIQGLLRITTTVFRGTPSFPTHSSHHPARSTATPGANTLRHTPAGIASLANIPNSFPQYCECHVRTFHDAPRRLHAALPPPCRRPDDVFRSSSRSRGTAPTLQIVLARVVCLENDSSACASNSRNLPFLSPLHATAFGGSYHPLVS